MKKFVVTYNRIPTAYNPSVSVVVEAGSESDAREIVKHSIMDLGPYSDYTYIVKLYTPPPPGKILL